MKIKIAFPGKRIGIEISGGRIIVEIESVKELTSIEEKTIEDIIKSFRPNFVKKERIDINEPT